MASINAEVYARVREKAKEHNLTEQDLKAVDTAKDQLQTHTYTGSVVGSSTAFLLAKKKKFNPIQILAVTAGGFLIGSQMGLISGVVAGLKTINTLPSPQRIINVIREVQLESVKGRPALGNNRPSQPVYRPETLSNQQATESYSSNDEFAPDMNDNVSGEGAWSDKQMQIIQSSRNNKNDNTSEASSGFESKPQDRTPQPSAWDKIRAQNLPNSAWAKLRMEAQKLPESALEIEKNKAARVQRLRENSDFNEPTEIPRTREEALERGTSRKNQWGDAL